VIKSRLLRSAADEHHAAQGLPRLRIRNFRSAHRSWPAQRYYNQYSANCRPNH